MPLRTLEIAPGMWRSNVQELGRDLADACSIGRLIAGLRAPWTGISLLLAAFGLFFDVATPPPFWRVALGAGIEELTFRALLQEHAERLMPGMLPVLPGVSRGCLIVSLAFAALHCLSQPVAMALLTFFPSLVLGALWTRFGSLWLCALLHLWYNAVLLYF